MNDNATPAKAPTPEELQQQQMNTFDVEQDDSAMLNATDDEGLAPDLDATTTDGFETPITPAADKQTTPAEGDAGNKADEKAEGDDKPADGDDATAAKKAKPSKASKRIDELTGNWRAEQRKSAQLERERDALTAKLQAQEKADADENSVPKQEDFETYEAFQEALVDWKVDQKLAAAKPAPDTKPHEGMSAEELTDLQRQFTAAGDKHADFKAKVLDDKTLPLTPDMVQIAAQTEHGAEILYALANDREIAADIAQLTDPLAIARALGKVEAGLNLEPTDDGTDTGESEEKLEKDTKPEPKPNNITRAPDPIKPVQTSEVADVDPANESMDSYFERRKKEEARANGLL